MVQGLAYKSPVSQHVIQFVERSTPSKPVHLVGTDRYFPSISDAARKTGHNVGDISKVVNGLRDSVHDDVFEIIQPI